MPKHLNTFSNNQLTQSYIEDIQASPSENIIYKLRKRLPHSANKDKNSIVDMVPYTKLSNYHGEHIDLLSSEHLSGITKVGISSKYDPINKYTDNKLPLFSKNNNSDTLDYNKNNFLKHDQFDENHCNEKFKQYENHQEKSNHTSDKSLDSDKLDNCFEREETPLITYEDDFGVDNLFIQENNNKCTNTNEHPKKGCKIDRDSPNCDDSHRCNSPPTHKASLSCRKSDGSIPTADQLDHVDRAPTPPDYEDGGGGETSWMVALQIFFPYLIAGFGTVGAGMVLDIVQHWPVFGRINELFILVPSLLGLKGNLEMTLASRLSTQANLGTMDTGSSDVDGGRRNRSGPYDRSKEPILGVHKRPIPNNLTLAVQASPLDPNSRSTPINTDLLSSHDNFTHLPKTNVLEPNPKDTDAVGTGTIAKSNDRHGSLPSRSNQDLEGSHTLVEYEMSRSSTRTKKWSDPGSRIPRIQRDCYRSTSVRADADPGTNKNHGAGGGQNWSLIGGNLALVQGQAAVIGFLASMTALVMGWFPTGQFNLTHAKILCASSILTASLASAILGVLMVVVVVLSRKLYLNPDNIATPIAASLGDLITLSLLGFISKHISQSIEVNPWICYIVFVLYIVLTPIWLYLCSRNEYTKDVLQTGWGPIIYSMLISSAGGFILDFTVHRFRGIAVFQPVINGVGGNLAAIQASRLSTYLHKSKGQPKDKLKSAVPNQTNNSKTHLIAPVPTRSPVGKWPSLKRTFFAPDINSKTARILLMLVVPGHLIFMYTISYMNAGHTTITPLFALVYLLAALIQVVVLLYLTEWMVNRMWVKGIDPDNAAIPYITAIGDLVGTSLLALSFYILWTIGDKDSDLGD